MATKVKKSLSFHAHCHIVEQPAEMKRDDSWHGTLAERATDRPAFLAARPAREPIHIELSGKWPEARCHDTLFVPTRPRRVSTARRSRATARPRVSPAKRSSLTATPPALQPLLLGGLCHDFLQRPYRPLQIRAHVVRCHGSPLDRAPRLAPILAGGVLWITRITEIRARFCDR
jgi:hypothetical protein